MSNTAPRSAAQELLYMKLKEFVRVQSCGEWSEETIEEDTQKLLENLSPMLSQARLEGVRLGIEAAAKVVWQGNCKGKWASPEDIRALQPSDVVGGE